MTLAVLQTGDGRWTNRRASYPCMSLEQRPRTPDGLEGAWWSGLISQRGGKPAIRAPLILTEAAR